MLNILLIDDSSEKSEITKKFLIDECNIDGTQITIANNINQGRKFLYSHTYDLLLLDLVLPRDDESEPDAEESIKFLNEIYYNSSINIPSHIIGFSQHEELIDSHHNDFLDKLWHLIPFSFTNNTWKDLLRNKICHLISTKENFEKSIQNKFQYDIGIVCALADPELSAILKLKCNWEKVSFVNDPNIYYRGTLTTFEGNSYRVIACSVNKMGMQTTAIISAMMITKFSLRYLFMTGICAGISKESFGFGDILVAENIIDYGSGKLVENTDGTALLKPELHQYSIDQTLLNKVQAYINDSGDFLSRLMTGYEGNKPNTVLSAKIVPMASGSYVVANKSFADSILKANRKISGIDMEGYSVYLAGHILAPCKSLVIKSICDFADSDKNDNFQKYASFTSASFLYDFIIKSM